MVAMIPGTGGTVRSTTVEGAIYELATLLEIAEDTPASNLGALERVNIDKFGSSGLLNVTFNLYGSYTIAANGAHTWIATEYLTMPAYVRGSGGTLKSLTYAGALAEAIDLLKQTEVDPLKNPINEKHVDYSYGMRGLSNFKGSCELKFTDTVNANGSTVTTVSPWYA